MATYALVRFTSPNAGVSVNQAGTDQYIAAAYGQAIKNLDVNAANIALANTFAALQTFSSGVSPNGSNTLTLPAATDTLMGKATTDVMTNKTLTAAILNGGITLGTPAYGQTSTGAVSLTAAQTFLTTSDVALNNTANYFDIVNTGSIGASGQLLLLMATAVALDTAAAANFLVRIWDSTTVFVEAELTTTGANLTQSLTVFALVSPSAAKTYSLSCKDRSLTTGLVKHTGNAGQADKSTSISYVRLA